MDENTYGMEAAIIVGIRPATATIHLSIRSRLKYLRRRLCDDQGVEIYLVSATVYYDDK